MRLYRIFGYGVIILVIDKKYLILPVSFHAARKRVRFLEKGKVIFDLEAAIDPKTPDYIYTYDVRRFAGLDLEIVCDEVSSFIPGLTDEKTASDFKEKYRPTVHFTAESGWINDPNGMVYYNGEYHLFYQHNPVLNKWGNMHWGHAVSRDLFHWEHRDEALFPDEMGTEFSGSGIIDYKNLSGLKEGTKPPLLLFYTAAGGNGIISQGAKFTQCMAYSADGGKTFKKYSKNPVVPHIEAENRDPKLVWCEEIKAYVMAIYLSDNRYELLKSSDLKSFKKIQEITLFGDAECPDFYPLWADSDKNKKVWVFSGASDKYYIGEFVNGKFQPFGEPQKLHYGRNSYAAQTFSGTEDGRVIRMAWNTSEFPDMPFNCAMCVPCRMSVNTIDGIKYLCANPAEEISCLYETDETYKVSDKSEFSYAFSNKAQDIKISCKANKGRFSLKLYGQEITVDSDKNEISLCGNSMPLCLSNDGELTMRIITDVNGAEIFAGMGQAHMCVGYLSDYCLDRLTINGDIPSEITVRIAELKSIY